MKKKTKNIFTTVFGILFGLTDLGLYITSRVGVIDYEVGIVEILAIAGLSYLLIQAYNETLQNFSKKMFGM